MVNTQYCSTTDVRNRIGLSTTDVDDTTLNALIDESSREVEMITGYLYTNANSTTEFLGPFPVDMFNNPRKRTLLKQVPVQTVTSILLLNRDGTTKKTLATTDYWLDTTYGILELKDDSFPTDTRNAAQIIYTYGRSTTPIEIRMLTECFAGMRALVRFMGGNYNYLESYTLPEQAVNKGDLYERMQNLITLLQDESNRLLDRIGRRANIQAAYSGGTSPAGVSSTNPGPGGFGPGR